jgi:hypothetical protein
MSIQVLQQPNEPEFRHLKGCITVVRWRSLRSELVLIAVIITLAILEFKVGSRHHTSWIYVTPVLVGVGDLWRLLARSIKENYFLRQGCATVGEIEQHGAVFLLRYIDQNGNKHTRSLSRGQMKNIGKGNITTVIFDPRDVTNPTRWALYNDMMWRLLPATPRAQLS